MIIDLKGNQLSFYEGDDSGSKRLITDPSKLLKIYNKFRSDLLDMNIPHYRPVFYGVRNSTAVSTTRNNISKIPEIGYSFSELSFIMGKIITSKADGIPSTSLKDSSRFSGIQSRGSFLVIELSKDGEVTWFYEGKGQSCKPELLVPCADIFKGMSCDATFEVILMSNTGTVDFAENSGYILSTKGYKPMRTKYDLYNYVKIRHYIPSPDNHSLELIYDPELNVNVLREILENYFNKWEV